MKRFLRSRWLVAFVAATVTALIAGVTSLAESGFWYSLYFNADANNPNTLCTVTGTIVPINGTRSVPPPGQTGP